MKTREEVRQELMILALDRVIGVLDGLELEIAERDIVIEAARGVSVNRKRIIAGPTTHGDAERLLVAWCVAERVPPEVSDAG